MKKLFILLIGLPFTSEGQLNTGIGAGWDTHGRAVAVWSVGCSVAKLVEVQAEIRPSVSRSVFAHNYMGGRIGLNLINPDDAGLSVIMGGGYFYDKKSSDKTSLNKYYWGTFVKSIIQVNERSNGCLFVEALYINNSAQFAVGIHYKFTKQERRY